MITKNKCFKVFCFVPFLLILVTVSLMFWLVTIDIKLGTLLVTIYFVVRGLMFMYGLLKGLYMRKRAVVNDSEINESINHIILIPVYKESRQIIEDSLQSIVNSDYNLGLVVVVFGIEESAGKRAHVQLNNLAKKYSKYVKEIIIFIHPEDIEGEVRGAPGANRTYALKSFLSKYSLTEEKINRNYLVTTLDCDCKLGRSFLKKVNILYSEQVDYENIFISNDLYLFSNNINGSPFIQRSFAYYLTLVNFQSWYSEVRNASTFSVYSCSLKTIVKNNFWFPEIGVDDNIFYWNIRSRSGRKFSGKVVHSKTESSLVEEDNRVKTLLGFYKQQFRWGYGSIVFVIALTNMYLRNKLVSFQTLQMMLILYWKYSLWLSMVFFQFVVFPLMYFYGTLKYVNTPGLSILLILIPTFLFFSIIVSIFFYQEEDFSVKSMLLIIFSLIIGPVQLIFFHLLPFIHAEIDMCVRRGVLQKFYVSKKASN